MKRIILIILSFQLLFPSCYFDVNFGRLNCIDEDKKVIDDFAKMALAFQKQNITPFFMQSKYENYMAKVSGVHSPINVSMPTPIMPSPPKMANVTNITIKSNNTNTPIGPCQNERERDWMAYCQSLYLEMGIDCFNTNKQAKDMIMSNMEKIKNCKYVK